MKNFFYIIRHGETLWSHAQLLQGRKDVPLSNRGRKQAKDMALLFKEQTLSYVGASPLTRTQQTAEIIAAELKIPKVTCEGLLARDYGIWEGKSIHTIKEENQSLCATLRSLSLEQIFYQAPLDSIESYHVVSNRAFDLLKILTTRAGNAILVTHTGVITAILLALRFPTFELPLLSHQGYIKLGYDGEQFTVEEAHGLLLPPQESKERVFIF